MHPQALILERFEPAGARPPRDPAIQRWCLCLNVVSPLRVGAFLLLWARISRRCQQRGHDRDSYYGEKIFFHLDLPQSSSASSSPALPGY
jgi:hypothetical protein